MTEDGEALLRAVLKSPEDWDAKLVLADWYEENGDLDRAVGMRWMAKSHKRPFYRAMGDLSWYEEEGRKEAGLAPYDYESDLPRWVYCRLSMGTKTRTSDHHCYKDPEEALMDFLQAFTQARKKGEV